MTKQTKITVNLGKLEEIKKQVGDTYRARVGVLGGKASRQNGSSGINNAELMLIHMFGSETRNIPARDPLHAPIIKHRRELIRKVGTGAMRAAFEAGNYRRMFELLGIAAESIVQNAFETAGDGLWPALSPATIKAKGSSRPLIDTAQLRRSVTSDVIKSGDSAKGAIRDVGAEE